MRIALAVATHAHVLESGRVIASGPSAEIADSELLHRSFLGAA